MIRVYEPQSIKIALVREKDPDFISSQVMKKDGTDYSHILILFLDENGIEKIFHAVGRGVCLDDPHEYMKDHVIAKLFSVDLKCSKDFFLGFVNGSVGKEYSQGQIAAIAVNSEDDNGDEKMICSELVGIVMTRMCGYSIPGDQDTWRPFNCCQSLIQGGAHEIID